MAKNSLITAPNWTTPNPRPEVSQANNPTGLRALLARLMGRFGPNGGLISNKNMTIPNIGQTLSNIRSTPIVQGGNLTLGNVGAGIQGIYQGGRAIGNFNDLSTANQNVTDLKNDVLSSYLANPLANSYLSADQRALLRKLRTGTYDDQMVGTDWTNGFNGAIEGIPNALLSGLVGGVTGGVPGAILGAGGSLLNSGVSKAASEKQNKTAELQALYEALSSAEQDYNAMRRPVNLRSAGLQNRYSSLLY